MTNSLEHLLNDFHHLMEEYTSTAYKFFSITKEEEKHFHQEISYGAIKLHDALALAEIMLYLKPKRILEIGSFLGLSTRWILEVSKGWGAQVTSIDPNIPHRKINFTRVYSNQFCASHKDRLTTIDAFASFANPRFKHVPVIDSPIGEFDFAFIDGNHRFNAVLQNTTLTASMMPQGGVIVGHDVFTHEAVAGATSLVADNLGSLEFYFVNLGEVSLGSTWKRAQWKKNKEFRDRLCTLFSPVGRQDGITMMHVPKSETTRASSMPIEELYGKTEAELHDESLPKRNMLLEKHLLKRTIPDQLRRWGY